MFRAVAVALCVLAAACERTQPAVDAPSSPWSQGPPLAVPRLEPGVTAVGDRVVVLGGFDTGVQAGNAITTRVDVFDTGTNTWSQLPDAPVAWTHVQLAAVGTTIYLLGGLEGASYVAHGESWKLDTLDVGKGWQPIAAMPAGQERGSAGVVVGPPGTPPGRIYLLGGASTSTALASCIFYDTIADTWGTLPDLPAPRSHPAAAARGDGTLFVAGGLGGLYADTFAGDTFALPLGATQWQPRTPMHHPRGGCAYGVVQTDLVCAGGEADTSALTYVEAYDMSADTWTDRALMPMSTAGTQGAVVGPRLFVPGGARELVLEPTSTLFIYAALLDTTKP